MAANTSKFTDRSAAFSVHDSSSWVTFPGILLHVGFPDWTYGAESDSKLFWNGILIFVVDKTWSQANSYAVGFAARTDPSQMSSKISFLMQSKTLYFQFPTTNFRWEACRKCGIAGAPASSIFDIENALGYDFTPALCVARTHTYKNPPLRGVLVRWQGWCARDDTMEHVMFYYTPGS